MGVFVEKVGRRVTSEQCRLNGAECLKLAQVAANPAGKMLLLHLADAWRRLAERIETDRDHLPPPIPKGNRP
jgi:hypothetical protein